MNHGADLLEKKNAELKINKNFEQLDEKIRGLGGLVDSNQRKGKISGFQAESNTKLLTKMRDVVQRMKRSFRQEEYGQIDEAQSFNKTKRLNINDLKEGKCKFWYTGRDMDLWYKGILVLGIWKDE